MRSCREGDFREKVRKTEGEKIEKNQNKKSSVSSEGFREKKQKKQRKFLERTRRAL